MEGKELYNPVKNFSIVKVRPDVVMVVPVSEMALSLEKHCLSHGEIWNYPTMTAAEEARQVLGKSIMLRGNRPWVVASLTIDSPGAE